MAKRNPANKGKGKAIKPVFGTVQCNGATMPAVLVASSKKGALASQLWAVVQGAKGCPANAPAFVLVTNITGIGPSAHALTAAQAQASYLGHPRRAMCSAAPYFGLKVPTAPAASAASAASAPQGA